jgi:hypothetical protein
MADYGRPAQFENAVIERAFPGRQIRVGDREGWGWYELEAIDAARGGASRAERDAFRLFAVFLSHWDNKAGNQRLTCLPGGEHPDGSCATPFALIHDFGATFGPKRADLAGWRTRPVWSDGATCQVSLRGTPYDGGTFKDARISEEGRALLAGGLARLRPEQVHALFSGARFLEAESADLAAWASAFQDRARQIVDRAPCPES